MNEIQHRYGQSQVDTQNGNDSTNEVTTDIQGFGIRDSNVSLVIS